MPLIFMCFLAPYARSASHTQTAPSISSPHPSARLSPYAGAVLPYVFTASPHSHQASKIPTLVSARPAFSGPTNQAPTGLHKFPASSAGAVPHVQAEHQPTEISVRVRHRFAMRRRHRRRSRGLHSSPPGGGQLRGGICESFSGCVSYCRIRSALMVSVFFFAAGCPRRGLSGYAHHLWLIPDPDSRLWQVPGRTGTRAGMTGVR